MSSNNPKKNPRTSEVIDFLSGWGNHDRETLEAMWKHSYPTWGKNHAKWNMHSGLGGTYILKALQWYQFDHEPGSTEGDYDIVMTAIHEAIDGMKSEVEI